MNVSPSNPGQPTSNLYLQKPVSQCSIGPEHFTSPLHAPTLHAKRPDHEATGRHNKSGKRKADDYARQKEIQAMSASMPMPRPKRPATYSGSGPLARDTTTVPGNPTRRLARPASQVSLPRQEDIAGLDAVPASFRIGVLSALSPRPTIKFESRRRLNAAGKQPVRRMSAQHLIPEEELAHSKTRIDELADSLDSSGIRELLERDRRHREQKKEADRARLHRRLQRRADRQQEEETRRRRAEEFASQSSAHVHAGLPPPQTDGEAASGPEHHLDQEPDPNPFADPANVLANVPATNIRNPFEDEKDMDIMQDPSDQEDVQEGPIAVKSPLHKAHAGQTWEDAKPSQAALSPPTSPIEAPADRRSFSQTSGRGRKVTADVIESTERDGQLAGQPSHNISSWTSFFKLRGRRKPNMVPTPSEFSNTSRESFARKQLHPTVPPARTFRRSDSAIPQRTLSRFREDLPELPISPPDSRVHSPEAAGSHLSSKQIRPSLSGTLDDKSLATSSSNPTPDRQRAAPVAIELDLANPDGNLSRSLASIDSEGSWLSGKPVKRSSGQASLSWRQSIASFGQHLPAEMEQEEDDLVKDEYLCRLSPAPRERRESVAAERKASSTIIDFQNERGQITFAGAADEQWHQALARQPTVVRRAEAITSREGLLREYDEDDNESSSIAGSSPRLEEPIQLMRARSVEYKGHVRRVSAGSARLLDIRRSSTVSTPRSLSLARPV
ncbi:hypothetical protein DV735_g123, partial [Chaetothyriales sp. CBS 134920]